MNKEIWANIPVESPLRKKENFDEIIKKYVEFYRKNPFEERTKKIFISEFNQEVEFINESVHEENFNEVQKSILTALSMRQEDVATERAVSYLKQNYFFDSIKQDKISEIWVYDKGIRKSNGESVIKEVCRKLFSKSYTPQRVNKVIAKEQRKFIL